MAEKLRHTIRFKKVDGVFDGISDDDFKESVARQLPDGISVTKCYSEYPRPYDHYPYVSVVTVNADGHYTKELTQEVEDRVRDGVTELVDVPEERVMTEGYQ